MYIDTYTRDGMEKSICDIFQLHPLELREKLIMIDRAASDDDDFIVRLDSFIIENAVNYPDEILLFHLSCRLHGTEDDVEGRNLAALLLTENPLSSLLKRAKIEFRQGEQHIEVYYKGQIVDWDECMRGNSAYMKARLGYYKGREDYCFNGFAFKDLLYKNSYARELYGMPEFLGQLTECLQCKALDKYYMENSTYYCYEYKLPLSMVMFDDHDTYSDSLKQKYLISCVLQRLYQYQTSNPRYMFDHDNPILRLPDDYTIPSNYYVGREMITLDMLSKENTPRRRNQIQR